jgi:hypothetical protein
MTLRRLAPLVLAASALGACRSESVTLAASAELVSSAPPPAVGGTKLSVESGSVEFVMDAPVEKIHGKAPQSVTGTLSIDRKDLTKTTGLFEVDLDKLEVFQSKQAKDGSFPDETKSDLQNEHVRNWMEINPGAKDREKHKRAQFVLLSVASPSQQDVSAFKNEKRSVDLVAKGTFILHGRKTAKDVELTVELTFDGDKLAAARVRTRKPFTVGLAEHDIHPRDALGSLLEKGLDKLTDKVAKEAPVTLDVTLKAAP